jgi:cobalt-zinc-cadmium efflux system protein
MSQSRRLRIVLGLNAALVAGLAAAGVLVNSVSLLATAADCIGDVFALGLGLLAVHLRDRHGRIGAINAVAAVNGVVLLVVSAGVLLQAIVRIVEGAPPVFAVPVLLGGVATAVVLGGGVLVLGAGAGREDLHMRSVLLDTASDGLAAAGVAVGGLVMALVGGAYWIDPAVAGGIALLVGGGAIRLVRDVIRAVRNGRAVDADPD